MSGISSTTRAKPPLMVLIVFMVLVVAILMPIAPNAQAAGGLTATVTDRTNSPVPGVQVTVMTTDLQRTAVTDADGRCRFYNLPAGTYTAKAELSGFETAVEDNVVVKSGGVISLSFALKIGCVDGTSRVDMGFASALQEATAIVQIRISESGASERCLGFCVCTEHVATADRVLKAPPPDAPLTTIRFLQEGAGPDRSHSGRAKPYAPGQEYVAFLRWDSATKRFLRLNGPIYIFPVRDGRVEFRRTDAPGLSDGMLLEEFIRALRGLLSAQVPGIAVGGHGSQP